MAFLCHVRRTGWDRTKWKLSELALQGETLFSLYKMVNGLFHPGSGLGNMLHRYVATRVLALDKGYDFGMIGVDNFKGKSFMRLDMGFRNGALEGCKKIEYPAGKITFPPFKNERQQTIQPRVWEEKTPYYNPDWNFIEDNTIIDGEFQDERYFEHRIDEINSWLTPYGRTYADNESICLIGFRGGEFYTVPELGLPKIYFEEGIEMMKKINPKMKFEVQTDDPVLARQFFPDYEIVSDIKDNWLKMRSFKYAIVANSSFYILPRLLRHNDNILYRKDDPARKEPVITIAPRYWDRYNIKKWERPYNYYKAFTYI